MSGGFPRVVVQPFSISCLPSIVFGEGSLHQVPGLAARFGRRILVVTGARSFRESVFWRELISDLEGHGLTWEWLTVSAEPSPELVDGAVRRWRDAGIDVVVGIGGGSVVDAAKAIAGLLPHGNSVMDHLEGVGREDPYRGPSTPLIAVPTTAGTGSEATKNAVLSVPGKEGFKKSFRHELLVPRYAVVDPRLLGTCPPELIAANGMDALTQLLESLVSLRANPFTDALAWNGLTTARTALLPWYEETAGGTPDAPAATAYANGMAYAALLSGITLAQAGLGSVHGLASPLGAYFPIPHGVVCGTLVAKATEINIRALRERMPGSPALDKYARIGALLSDRADLDPEAAWRELVDTLGDWTERLALPRLASYGVTEADFPRVLAGSRGSSMQTNPVVLSDAEVGEILRARL